MILALSLFYVLPLLLSLGSLYYVMKRDGETVEEFVKLAWYTLIPLVNAGIILILCIYIVHKWLRVDEKWNEIKKRKL